MQSLIAHLPRFERLNRARSAALHSFRGCSIKRAFLTMFRRYHFPVCNFVDRLNTWRDSTIVDEMALYWIPTMYLVYHTRIYKFGYFSPCFHWVPVTVALRFLLTRGWKMLYRRIERAALTEY